MGSDKEEENKNNNMKAKEHESNQRIKLLYGVICLFFSVLIITLYRLVF